jgi:hypothetical protein
MKGIKYWDGSRIRYRYPRKKKEKIETLKPQGKKEVPGYVNPLTLVNRNKDIVNRVNRHENMAAIGRLYGISRQRILLIYRRDKRRYS